MGQRTNTGNCGTEVRQYGGTGVAHLTLDRQLSLNVHLASPSADEEGGDTGESEYRREDDDGPKLDQHRKTDLEQGR